MTSQSTASFKVPKRKFKAKSSCGPLKTSETGLLRPKVLLDACLNERTEFEMFSPAECGPLAEFRKRVCLVMQRRACMIHYQAMFNLILSYSGFINILSHTHIHTFTLPLFHSAVAYGR